jgi:branched-subunit amino acid transport protein
LRFVPPAVLAALIAPEVLMPAGNLDPTLGNERLLAGTLAWLVAWRTRSTWLTIAAGMLALWALNRW